MFDHYLKYGELTDFLHNLVEKHHEIAQLSSIGKTYEGRDIWLVTVSDPATGAPETKKAFCMDGNIHGGEIASSMAVLYTLDKLLSGYKKDEKITDLLENTTLYAIPRIHADGAEYALTRPGRVRGGVEKFFPPRDGVVPQDLDGDGEIVQMRVKNPAGRWKVSDLDPRIMEERGPLDLTGEFYDVLPEGMVRGEDLISLHRAPDQEDLDPNRQFPFNWKSNPPSEFGQPIGGPSPLHDPEVRAVHDFMLAHPNICFEMNYHTFGGLHITPLDFCPELQPEGQDAEAYSKIDKALHSATGYQVDGIFPPGAKDIACGSYTTWLYWERGVTAYVTELWDWHKQCDPERSPAWSMFFVCCREQFEREQTCGLRWDEEQNGGKGFLNWTKFQHPQLGEVELGGWKEKFTQWNPPIPLLQGVLEKACAACETSLALLPRLKVDAARLIGDNKVEIALSNTGFLPTSSSAQAVKKGVGNDLSVTVECGGQTICKQLISLDGFSRMRVVIDIAANPGDPITVTAKASRAGCAQLTTTL